MKNSATLSSQNPQRIRISKRSQTSPPAEDGKKSINIAQTLEHQKALAQAYREKNERNTIKCRFLYNKLTALGNLQGVPQMIAAEVSEVDVKIKQLQFQLHFKQSQQMKKLRKKVMSFLQLINFQIQPQEMEKIQDQIEIVLFLLDIFEEKFNEMTAERKEINEIVARLEENSQLQQEDHADHFRKENEHLMEKISLLEGELNKLKNEDMKRLETEMFNREQGGNSTSSLQLAAKEQELQKANRRIQELEGQLKDVQARFQVLSGNLERAKRQENRWKQRYRLMEAQKEQRIRILEESLNRQLRH